MPMISVSGSVAANTRSTNIFAGQAFEFLRAASIVSFYLSGSAAGLEADIQIGGESITQAAVIPSTNRFPVRPDDLVAAHGGLPGERLFGTLLNTTAGALTYQAVVDIA